MMEARWWEIRTRKKGKEGKRSLRTRFPLRRRRTTEVPFPFVQDTHNDGKRMGGKEEQIAPRTKKNEGTREPFFPAVQISLLYSLPPFSFVPAMQTQKKKKKREKVDGHTWSWFGGDDGSAGAGGLSLIIGSN